MKATGIAALIAILAIALAVVPALGDDSDALATINNGSDEVSWEFNNSDGGYISFSVNNLNGSFTMDVTVYENYNASSGTGKVVGTLENFRVPANGVTEIRVDMPDFTEVGTHTLTVVCTPAGQFENNGNTFTQTVEVTQTLLSNWATYAVIIVVVIVIVIFAYLKIRDSPKKKVDMTFEELEAQRKAEMAEKAEKKQRKEKPAAPTTERKRYVAKSESPNEEKRAKEPEPIQEKPEKSSKLLERSEKKEKAPKPTFEELEAQKQAEKAEKQAKKADKSAEKKKSERERYLEEKRKKEKQE